MRFIVCFLLLAMATAALTGCSRNVPKSETTTAAPLEAGSPPPGSADPSQPTAENPGAPENPQPAAALPAPPPPSRVVNARALNPVRQNIAGQVDGQLTEELRTFIQQKKRMPQTFSEFATVRLDSVPRPPEGKKWAIDSESLEVKAVSAQ